MFSPDLNPVKDLWTMKLDVHSLRTLLKNLQDLFDANESAQRSKLHVEALQHLVEVRPRIQAVPRQIGVFTRYCLVYRVRLS